MLTQSPIHLHLLQHPVIMSFLMLKWQKIHRTYSVNLRFFTLFTYIVTRYIFEDCDFANKGQKASETIALFIVSILLVINLMLSTIRDLIYLIILKRKGERSWKSFPFFLLEAIVIIGSPLLIISFDFIKTIHMTEQEVYKFREHKEPSWTYNGRDGRDMSYILSGYLFLFVGILTCREIFQALLSVKKYICQKENWIEMLLIGLTYYILFRNKSSFIHTNYWTNENSTKIFNEVDDEEITEDELSRILSGFVIVLSWTELIVLVAKHPNMSR